MRLLLLGTGNIAPQLDEYLVYVFCTKVKADCQMLNDEPFEPILYKIGFDGVTYL